MRSARYQVRPTESTSGDRFEHIYGKPISQYRCPDAHHCTQPKIAQNHAVCISQAALTQWRNICRTDAELTQSGYEPYGVYWTYTHTHMHRSMHLQAQIRPATADIPNRSTSFCLAPMRHRLQQACSNNFAHTSTHVDISHKYANSFNSEQWTARWCSESIANHGMTSSRHHLPWYAV